MSDFLTRLIERSSGKAEVVQPVVPPVFAQGLGETEHTFPPQDSKKSPEGSEDNTEAEGETRQKPTKPSRYKIRSSDIFDRPPLQDIKSPKNIASQNKSATIPTETCTEDQDDGLSLQPKGLTREDSLFSDKNKIPIIQEQSETSKINSLLEKITKGETNSTNNLVSSIEREYSPFIINTNKKDDASCGRLSLGPFTIKKVIRREALAKEGQDKIVPLDHNPDKIGLSSSPPAIKVTIGRIDVRAIMQQLPTPRRIEAPKPKLSLDDYLKQRNGG